MSPITARTLRVNTIIVINSLLIGAVIGLIQSKGDNVWEDAWVGSLIGLTVGLGCTASEIWVLSNPKFRITRRLPPVVLALLRGAIYIAVITLALSVPSLVTDAPPMWEDTDFGLAFGTSVLIALAISTVVEVIRLLGREATVSLFTGRYHRPRLENRVVLFADVVGSTSFAETVGELTFHRFLSDVYQDVAAAIAITRGDVHRYVGDEVIVTWPVKRGTETGLCVICAEEMHKALRARMAFYQKRYDHEPRLRVAIHCGQVAAGEIGDWKKEIALLGDTMNTTARIEGAAKSLGVDTILSDDLARHLPDDLRASLRRLPDFAAAGKQSNLVLWTSDS